MSKQYGLYVPNKNKQSGSLVKKPSIFEDESDSDNEPSKPTGLKTSLKRQDRLLQEKAVEEDPTVYQYDEVYDEIDRKRTESKLSRKDLDKKPKYINKLLQSAERRKRENERRIERQVQKEREAEGELYKDKESFVTSAYRKKLEELRKLEEQEKREEYLEAIGDVTKQGNLDGFYRHLYDQKVLYEDKVKEETVNEKECNTPKQINADENEQIEIKKEESSESEDKDEVESNVGRREIRKNVSKRTYRKRGDSESEQETAEREEQQKMQHLPSNLDADSDFSIDSSSEEDGDRAETTEKKQLKLSTDDQISKNETEEPKSEEIKEAEDQKERVDNDVALGDPQHKEEEMKPTEVKEKKPKTDIWKKRTVGVVFEEALKRYYERKAQREAGTFSRF